MEQQRTIGFRVQNSLSKLKSSFKGVYKLCRNKSIQSVLNLIVLLDFDFQVLASVEASLPCKDNDMRHISGQKLRLRTFKTTSVDNRTT